MMRRGWITQYVINMAMAVDQFASTVLAGHPDDTISQRLGRALESGNPHWVAKHSATLVDLLALILFSEKNHCLESLKGKSMAAELWSWGGKKEGPDA